ncbi:hypothetical protein [Actinomadura napierensis]|uniref:Uncharacterized protein n=1 Tax=Actinomadura napierensis TaxID=267854 RepID=A0ABN2YGN1_9ACTN
MPSASWTIGEVGRLEALLCPVRLNGREHRAGHGARDDLILDVARRFAVAFGERGRHLSIVDTTWGIARARNSGAVW